MISFLKNIIKRNVILLDIKSLLYLKIKETIHSKKTGSLLKKTIDFSKVAGLPEMDAKFMNSDISDEFSFNGSAIDYIDFEKKQVTQYYTAAPPLSRAIRLSKKTVKRKNMPKNLGYSAYFDAHKITPHTCHMSPNGYICATNKYYIYFIDVKKDKLYILPGDYNKKMMLYCDTGGFSPDYKYWYFVRWPYEDTIAIRNNKAERAHCQICRLTLETMDIEVIEEINYFDDVHQVSISKDYKYLVFTTFMQKPNIPYPEDVSIKKHADGYRRSHDSGLKLTTMITYNLETKKYWEAAIPVPVPAHFEFDPIELHTCYLSAHQFVFHKTKVVLEGPGVLFKVKIAENNTTLTHRYTNHEFYRIQNHTVFRYKDTTYIAVATTPFKFELIYADDLSLWRKIRIFPDPPPDLSLTGNGFWQGDPPLTLNVSSDGKYIACGMKKYFGIYDVEKDQMTDILLSLPNGRGQGHTRDFGM
jgi:hypothetical protein